MQHLGIQQVIVHQQHQRDAASARLPQAGQPGPWQVAHHHDRRRPKQGLLTGCVWGPGGIQFQDLGLLGFERRPQKVINRGAGALVEQDNLRPRGNREQGRAGRMDLVRQFRQSLLSHRNPNLERR
jgi:hypothetical protein